MVCENCCVVGTYYCHNLNLNLHQFLQETVELKSFSFWVDFKRKTQFEFELVSMGCRNPSRRSAANQEYKSSCVVDNLALFFPSELLQLAITYDFSLKIL